MISKNKNLFLKIYIPFVIITIIALIVLQILGSKKRVGYLTDFNLNIERTLKINENKFIKYIELNGYNFTNENIINYKYVYQFKIRYYDKTFRNSDIYGVYLNTNNLPNYIKEIKFREKGSPYGYLI